MRKLITCILLILLFNPFGLFNPAFKFTGNLFTNFLLNHYGEVTRAIIIDELNYKKNPTSSSSKFSYSYVFAVDEKKYKNDSEDTTFKVGDTIEIEYYKNDPNINKPLHLNK
jgi:hypothetical protein